LRLRDNITGDMLDLDDYAHLTTNIFTPEKWDFTLDELIEFQKTDCKHEGCVVEFFNGYMIKVKTLHYFALHRLITEELYREDYVISLILNEKIDDVICQVPKEHTETHAFIEDIGHTINNYIDRMTKDIKSLGSDFDGDFKTFTAKYLKHPLYHYTVKYLRKQDLYTILKDDIIRKTYFLENARTWLKENGYEKKYN
jgi:hypothetical protein